MAILPGTRIRDNGIFGNITDNPLTIGATTYNSPDLADLVAVSSNHAIVTLDPLRQFGDPEIVMITAHTAAATVATIQRGMYGTAARAHPVGTLWVHAATTDDYIEIVTSGTRPSDQYEGQFIFETNTNKLMGFGGVDWAPRDAGGQIGYAQAVIAQNGVGPAQTDVTSLSVAVTVGTGRRIRISSQITVTIAATAAASTSTIVEGVTVLNRGDVTLTGAGFSGLLVSVVLSPTAGSHTYKIQVGCNTGTINLPHSATNPGYILVEDIGAA